LWEATYGITKFSKLTELGRPTAGDGFARRTEEKEGRGKAGEFNLFSEQRPQPLPLLRQDQYPDVLLDVV